MFYYITVHLLKLSHPVLGNLLARFAPGNTSLSHSCPAQLPWSAFTSKPTLAERSTFQPAGWVMAGMKVPHIVPPRWVNVTGWQTKPKSAATSQQRLVTAVDLVCSIKMSEPGPGRKAEVQADRPGGDLIGAYHCPLPLEERHPPCLWHFTCQPSVAQGQSQKGWPWVAQAPLESCYAEQDSDM